MTTDQISTEMMRQAGEIRALWESAKSAHRRIDENDRVTEGIHRLAVNMEVMAEQLRALAERIDAAIERVEASQRSQGERIGALEKEPAQKWKSFVKQVFNLIVAAIVGGIVAYFKN